MAIKHILVPLTGRANTADAAVCAMKLAKQLNAHVTVGYEDMIVETLYFGPGIDGFGYGTLYGDINKLRDQQKTRARDIFDQTIAATRLKIVNTPSGTEASAFWFDQDAQVSLISLFDTLTDIIVLDVQENRDSPTGRNVFERALFDAHRPVLIVPSGIREIDRLNVLVAWNGSREAARSARHALDLIEPKTKVTVVQVGDIQSWAMPAERLIDYLGWHGITPELQLLADGPGATHEKIIDEARRIGAGCIVMGGYTHSRARELLFGGVTKFMLRSAPIPVLMTH